ncbi:MAG: tRNA (adenosine(37)-N6)-threonylcarbamoyltransferase complex ATPase subunit type 1 TsaE [Pseudomonadota bacterium]
MTPQRHPITLSEPEMYVFAAKLSQVLMPGDTVLLDGPVGAGKTTLARAIIQSAQGRVGAVDDVPSPTFTLLQSYPVGDITYIHMDLYRLTSAEELEELGLWEPARQSVFLIEWPDRMEKLRPKTALTIRIEDGDTTRTLHFESENPAWAARLERIAAA